MKQIKRMYKVEHPYSKTTIGIGILDELYQWRYKIIKFPNKNEALKWINLQNNNTGKLYRDYYHVFEDL